MEKLGICVYVAWQLRSYDVLLALRHNYMTRKGVAARANDVVLRSNSDSVERGARLDPHTFLGLRA